GNHQLLTISSRAATSRNRLCSRPSTTILRKPAAASDAPGGGTDAVRAAPQPAVRRAVRSVSGGIRRQAEMRGALGEVRTMRDPDLVLRAERAAIALERAWDHWRVMHGLDTGPLPPMTSYVGYSSEAPWGQPRVVFGVPAEEAERLAALLYGHDCSGPV